jgi:hypothetical protein
MAFTAGYYDADVDTASRELRLVVGAKECHLVITAFCSGAALVTLFEGTTKTGGTAVTVVNRNRVGTPAAAGMTVTHTPGGAGDGAALRVERMGTTGAFTASSGTGRDRLEWILKPSAVYLLRVTTLADNLAVNINLDWYEED